MISLELSTIQAKDEQRAMLAEAMASYSGQIEQLPGIQAKPLPPHSWRGDLVLPGSSTNTRQENKDLALAKRIRELTEKGAGITAIGHELKVDTRRLTRIAAEYGITLNDLKRGRPAESVKVIERRAALAVKIRPLAARGLRIDQIAAQAGCGKETAILVMEQFNIPRGPKMNLEA